MAEVLKASKQLGRTDVAPWARGLAEKPIPADKKHWSDYWLNRGRLAALENHKQDALAYYHLALQTRQEAPKMRHGMLDDLTDEALKLWKELGGSEVAWAVWSKSPGGAGSESAEGRWEKPTKELPAFELTDLSGKTWRLKDLGGKTVLINLWTKWCGPCNAELPKLQKLYAQLKTRQDVEVLTFNLDENLELVAPFPRRRVTRSRCCLRFRWW